jgi:hypothetical protein
LEVAVPLREAETDPLAHDAADAEDPSDLARLLRRLRRREARQRGDSPLTYRELAAKTGFAHSTVGAYLTGVTLAPADRFDVLIRLLGATAAEQRALATARDRVEEGARAAPRAWPAAVGPHELPPEAYGFTGRRGPLAELDGLLATGSPPAVPIWVVCGTAGVGKTALALHWAHRVAGRFEGCLYLDLQGYGPVPALAPAEALGALLRSLAAAAGDAARPAELASRYRSALAGRRLLVLLDNARSADQVRPLLPGTPSCAVLVTSRDSLAGLVARDGARRLCLDPLPPAEAVDLLRTLVGSRPAAGPVLARAVVEACGGLPLALRIAAELAARPAANPADLLAALAAEHRRLDVLAVGGDPGTEVRTVLSWSYRQLPPEAARAFRLLGLHPGREIGAGEVAALAGTSARRAGQLVEVLVCAHLAGLAGPGRYALPDLLRAYARELAGTHDSGADRHAALARLAAHRRRGPGPLRIRGAPRPPMADRVRLPR